MAAEVYGELGDYGSIVPSWLVHPGVQVYVDRPANGHDRGELRSFLLLGFFEPLSDCQRQLLVDLLAIAVAPAHQRQGVGRRLLREALDIAQRAARGFGRADMRLTVAHTNPVAQRLFSSEGFEVLDPHHGSYDRGQRAIRMTQPLTIA
jgi:ribosomal protein S18 acetylase RimI-like enzyme